MSYSGCEVESTTIGGHIMQPAFGKRVVFLAVPLMLSACGGGGGGTVSSAPPTTLVTTPLTTWSDVQPNTNVEAKGRGQQAAYTYDPAGKKITSISDTAQPTAVSAIFMFDGSSALSQVSIDSGGSLAGGPTSALNADFVMAVSNTATNASKAVVSNPKNGAWNYQSFGVWENGLDSTSRTVGVFSVGNNTGTAIPGSGQATFTGKVAGSYIDTLGQGNTALADLQVIANFGAGARSLDFSTSNTVISKDPGTVAFAPRDTLNLTGTLNLATDGTNSFTGTLTTASGLSGTSTGQFYGPNAEELGGTFFLPATGTSVETYSGAYGASR
jgi:hypothetical protein